MFFFEGGIPSMASIQFRDELLTGNSDIDRQHRMMFAWCHKIVGASGVDSETIARALRFLDGYVNYHFHAEEEHMSRLGYPKKEHHARQHELMKREMQGIKASALKGDDLKGVTARLHMFFNDWFTYHITELDTGFAKWIRENRSGKTPHLPTAAALVKSGVLSSDFRALERKLSQMMGMENLNDIRYVKFPGQISASEVRARRRYKS